MLRRLLLVVPFAAILSAAPITYRFSGTGSGTLNGNAFTNNAFEVSIAADTDDIANQPSIGATGILDLTGFITLGSFGTIEFTNPIVVFTFDEYVGFGNFVTGNAVMGSNNALFGFGLLPVGPTNIGNNVNLSQFTNVGTNAGLLTFSAMSEVTFEAEGADGIPEPSTYLMIAPALLLLMRRRR